MAEPTAATTSTDPAPDWLSRLASKRREVGYALLALMVIFVVVAAAAGMRASTTWQGEDSAVRNVELQYDYFLITLASGFCALVMAGGAVYQLFGESRPGHDRDSSRLLVMAMGALTGLVAACFIGLGLGVVWRDTILGGWTAWKGPQGWKVWVVIAGLFGGLALAFVSIQLARANERTSSGQRRLLYGFNAMFTAMLLAAILLFVNLLAYAPWGPLAALGKEYSWAQRNLYEITEDSQKILNAIEKPTRVYAILPGNDALYYPVLALLENCKEAVNDAEKFDFEFLSPDRDRERVGQLAEDYKFEERAGLLLVYGSGAGKDFAFIKRNDLEGVVDPRSRGSRFNGEQILMTEINLLEQGRSRPTIYVTQGNGELALTARPGGTPFDRMDSLKKGLELTRFKVKALVFSPVEKPPDGDTVYAKEVPADTGVLVIAGPREPLPKFAIDAIADYLDKRQGKLLLFFDVAVGPDRKMVRTGLEDLMKKYNVVVEDERVMHVDPNLARDPTRVSAAFPKSRSGLAAELSRLPTLPYFDVRPVRALEKPIGPYRVEILAEVVGNVWTEKDLDTEPRRLLTRMMDNPKELSKRIEATKKPVPIAVTVSAVAPGMGGHAGREGVTVPQMVVYGDATWLSNAFWNDQGMAQVFGMVLGAELGWLRQRPEILSIPNKHSDTFVLPTTVSFGRTVFLPGVLMMASIIGLGAGVWIVRRR